jgi:phage shock protein C
MPEKTGFKRLYRSTENRMIAGVLGGMGEYLNLDPVAVRVLYIIFLCMTGLFPLVLAYIIMYLIIPKNPNKK